MDRDALFRKYSKLLDRYGFSETYTNGLRSSFDIISKKRDRIVILKFVENIDSLSQTEADTLKKLDNFFNADVFVLFKNYKGGKPEKDRMFTRHGVSCISYSTFEDTLNGAKITQAQKFMKRKYRIDSSELKRLRKMQDLSAKELSRLVKVSKDTIYRYEKGGYAKELSINRLQSFFKTNLEEVGSIQKSEHKYEYQMMGENLDLGFLELNASPFEMLAKKNFRYEIGKESDARTMKKIASFYKRFSEVLNEDNPFFVSYKEKTRENFEGIPVLSKRELERIKNEKELLDVIESRKKD